MVTQKENRNVIIKEVINEINGLAFGSSQVWSEGDRAFFENRYSRIFSLFPEIKKNDIGLEVGLCGGIMAFSLKKFFLLKKLYALEHPTVCSKFTKKYLDKLRRSEIILKPCDLHIDRLPWPDDFFDFVIFSEIMEHLIPVDIPIVIQEIKRVLKKDGWLFISTPNIASLIKRINLFLGKNPIKMDLDLHEGATYGHIREYTMKELVNMIQSKDFKIRKRNYFMIDEKRSFFIQLEFLAAKFLPFLANNLAVLAKKS